MPELPEVETVVTDLRPILTGSLYIGEEYSEISGRKVLDVFRRGKFINILFEDNFVMTIHLRMTGRLIVQKFDDEPLPYERVRIDFDKCSVRFCDLRKFGRVWVNKISDYEVATGISKLGVEPFSGDFTSDRFKELLQNRRGNIKKWLLDQSLVAGIGNIYADEACFYAGVKPGKDVSELSEDQLNKLHKSILIALSQGIENRGTSVSDYADAYGKSGNNQELLYVYGRGNRPCLKCSNILVKTKVAGRGTVYCEGCQE